MKAKAKELIFISWIKRDGSGTLPVPEEMLENMLKNPVCKDDFFIIKPLSMSHRTFIAIGFNCFVVQLKMGKYNENRR